MINVPNHKKMVTKAVPKITLSAGAVEYTD